MKRFLKRVIEQLGYRVEGTRFVPRPLLVPSNLRQLEFDDVVCRRMFEVGPELHFIQIGAFDGIVGDPLQRYIERCGWHGVLVEPQAKPAALLRERYHPQKRVAVIQAAVAGEPGRRTLFTVDVKEPAWAGGLASFDRAHILKHAALVPRLAESIAEEQVDCITFDTVLKEVSAARLDLLQLDAEGADAELLALFPFDRVRPAIIHFEIKNLPIGERNACLDRLVRYRYRFAPSGNENMLAVLC